MAALDQKTGKTVWTCTGTGDRPGYASPILVDHEGLKQVVTVMSESVVGVRASDGELLWRYPHKVYMDENITTPLFHNGFVIVSGCGRKGTTSLKLTVSGNTCSVTKAWNNRRLDNKYGCLTYADGMFYLFSDKGGMALAKPGADGFEVTGRLQLTNPGKRPTWAHPVVSAGGCTSATATTWPPIASRQPVRFDINTLIPYT